MTDVLTVAVDFKALALFSPLFGVGLAIQFERLAGNARRALTLNREDWRFEVRIQ